jgi:hypothetical protein
MILDAAFASCDVFCVQIGGHSDKSCTKVQKNP